MLEEFAEALRARRKTKRVTQEQLAKTLGVSRMTIYNWEAGRHGPSEPLMRSLALALEAEPEDLWPGWTPEAVNRGGQTIGRSA